MKYRELSGFAGTRVRTADARNAETQVGASHLVAGSRWTCSDKIPKQHGVGGDSLGPGEKYRFGPFEVHTGARELSKGGTKIKLRGQPYLILEVLLSRAGEVVTREEIRARLWPADTFVDFEHGLNTSVKKLRQVLCDSAEAPRYIETEPRLGYRFIAPVEVVEQKTKSPIDIEAARVHPPGAGVPPQAGESPNSNWRILWFGLALALLFAGIWFVRSYRRMPSSVGSSAMPATASLAKRINSVAVLPFENLSNAPG